MTMITKFQIPSVAQRKSAALKIGKWVFVSHENSTFTSLWMRLEIYSKCKRRKFICSDGLVGNILGYA